MQKDEVKSIFLSWSGDESKKIAKKFKDALTYFFGSKIKVFFSQEDIPSGAEWFSKIKEELQLCKLGILCITKENFDSPWINFEAGAMIACGIKVVPVLFGTSRLAYKSPMDSVNNVAFEKDEFCKFLKNINDDLELGMSSDNFEKKARKQYTDFKNSISSSLKSLQDKRVFSSKYVYPQNINNVNIGTLYISTPMASIGEPEYKLQHEFLLKLEEVLKDIGFKQIISPAITIEKQEQFDGSTKANFDNYKEMKQVDSFLIIYPKPMPTSVLIEIGYAIALSKKIVIFTKDQSNLPFMLKEADSTIPNLKIYTYVTYEDILNTVKANKMALFEVVGGDDK